METQTEQERKKIEKKIIEREKEQAETFWRYTHGQEFPKCMICGSNTRGVKGKLGSIRLYCLNPKCRAYKEVLKE